MALYKVPMNNEAMDEIMDEAMPVVLVCIGFIVLVIIGILLIVGAISAG